MTRHKLTDKDWTGDAQSVMATLNASSHSLTDRAERDYYATPLKAVSELIRLETFRNPIWEPACGEDHIATPLRDAGYTVYSSDIVDRIGNEICDFLDHDTSLGWHGDIVTNPPFSKALEFATQAVSICDRGAKIALFLRVQFLEGVKRRTFFETHPPIRIWVSSRNLRCAKNGDFLSATGNASTYCWFIWEVGFKGAPTVGWFN